MRKAFLGGGGKKDQGDDDKKGKKPDKKKSPDPKGSKKTPEKDTKKPKKPLEVKNLTEIAKKYYVQPHRVTWMMPSQKMEPEETATGEPSAPVGELIQVASEEEPLPSTSKQSEPVTPSSIAKPDEGASSSTTPASKPEIFSPESQPGPSSQIPAGEEKPTKKKSKKPKTSSSDSDSDDFRMKKLSTSSSVNITDPCSSANSEKILLIPNEELADDSDEDDSDVFLPKAEKEEKKKPGPNIIRTELGMEINIQMNKYAQKEYEKEQGIKRKPRQKPSPDHSPDADTPPIYSEAAEGTTTMTTTDGGDPPSAKGSQSPKLSSSDDPTEATSFSDEVVGGMSRSTSFGDGPPLSPRFFDPMLSQDSADSSISFGRLSNLKLAGLKYSSSFKQRQIDAVCKLPPYDEEPSDMQVDVEGEPSSSAFSEIASPPAQPTAQQILPSTQEGPSAEGPSTLTPIEAKKRKKVIGTTSGDGGTNVEEQTSPSFIEEPASPSTSTANQAFTFPQVDSTDEKSPIKPIEPKKQNDQ